jgi:CRP/FNR family cyclic AMP-dependent transcriptional regulator
MWEALPVRAVRPRVPILELDPDLGRDLDEVRRRAAARYLTVPIQGLDEGEWDIARLPWPAGRLGFLVVDGVMMRSHAVGTAVSAELLGAGDVIRPLSPGYDLSLAQADCGWQVISSARVAVLDPPFLKAAVHWPEVVSLLFERAVQRARYIAFQMAIMHVRRIDSRLLLLFWRHLAARWGRVTPEGVVVPLRLKHAVLGMLIGAQRPSVTTGLKHLYDAGALAKRPDGGWLLKGEPPSLVDGASPAAEVRRGSTGGGGSMGAERSTGPASLPARHARTR